MSPSVTTRFAPSPTGFLHVGSARTALYNYLYAHLHHGIFRLRIEDTDQKRSSNKMTLGIFEGLQWLGLDWKQDVIYQGGNASRHRDMAESLLRSGSAYPCFCTHEELEINRQNFQYDGHCRKLSENEIQKRRESGTPYSIRFKVPHQTITWEDVIHGKISIRHQEIEDFIIQRSDSTPVYQLAVVVDDHDMGITHVIRGDDHISNTPKQLLLYQAFGWEIPLFAHVPLILGDDKKRLSKRHGATSIEEYQQMGILPEALFNFLAILGWQPENNEEILSREEIKKKFSLTHVSRKPAVFDEKKLAWMNQQYILKTPAEDLFQSITPFWENAGFFQKSQIYKDQAWMLKLIELLKPRAVFLRDFVELARYFFEEPHAYDPKGLKKHLADGHIWTLLEKISQRLQTLDIFRADSLEHDLRKVAETAAINPGKLIHPLRLGLTGRSASPGLFEVMELLGKEEVMQRLNTFLKQKNSLQKEISHLLE